MSADPKASALPGVPRRRPSTIVKVPTPEEQRPARRPSAYEAEMRQRDVERLRLRGMSVSEIAKELKIHYSTAAKDMRTIQKRNRERIDHFKQSEFVGESLIVYDEVIRQAWDEFHAAIPKEPPPDPNAPASEAPNTAIVSMRATLGANQRLKALDLIRTTQNDKLKALQDCGIVNKVAQQVEHKHVHQLPWTDDLKEAVVRQMMESQLRPGLPEPTLDLEHEPGVNHPEGKAIIDVEATPTKP